MLRITKPTADDIQQYLDRLADAPFSYKEVGSSNGERPRGFNLDHDRVQLGTGKLAFVRARQAIQQWKMFPPGFVELCWPNRPIATGTVVLVMFRVVWLWSLSPCRIVYVIDEQGESERFGFAYGTLSGHFEKGEERFLVEWNHGDDIVTYDLRVVSRPQHWLARIGYPYVRRVQRRFRRLSAIAMQQHVARGPTE